MTNELHVCTIHLTKRYRILSPCYFSIFGKNRNLFTEPWKYPQIKGLSNLGFFYPLLCYTFMPCALCIHAMKPPPCTICLMIMLDVLYFMWPHILRWTILRQNYRNIIQRNTKYFRDSTYKMELCLYIDGSFSVPVCVLV